MRIYPYWEKGSFKGVDPAGQPAEFTAWGWSDESDKQAKAFGDARAKKIFLAIAADPGRYEKANRRRDEYDYLDTPPREEIVSSLPANTDAESADTQPAAIVTRVRYGALVLNVSSLLFVDIDLPELPPNGIGGAIRTIVSPAYRKKRLAEPYDQVTNRVRDWASQNPGYGFRFYQTRAGYRLLFTSHHFDPLSNETASIFEQLGADPLYRRLTRKQESFRARLTPKPWRIGQRRPPNSFPRRGEQSEAFQSWLARYDAACQDYATCSYIDRFGPETIIPQLQELVDLHDRHCKATEDLPLA